MKISKKDARRLALLGQHLTGTKVIRGLKGTLSVIKQIKYVQIDTISIVDRAHHHTLWNRVHNYDRSNIEKLVSKRDIFEYWSHAAAYLPMNEYRFSLPRMHAIRDGQRHWYDKNKQLMGEVYKRFETDGPLRAADFAEHKGTGNMWEWSPTKQAIEHLFMEGRLLVTQRKNFQKIFDLAERVIPTDIDTQLPTQDEYCRYLINSYLGCHGIGRTNEFSYLRKGLHSAIRTTVNDMLDEGTLIRLTIRNNSNDWYAKPNHIEKVSKRLVQKRVKLLSPFDNLVIQRDRIEQLFNFSYQLECYVPAAKRKYGYFCMPILWLDKLVGRMDAKADRKLQTFFVLSLQLESDTILKDEFLFLLAKEIKSFAHYCACEFFDLSQIEHKTTKNRLQKLINEQ